MSLCNLLLTRDVLAKDKMLNNKGIYQRYEIEWIGREGLAPETHDAYLKEFINHFYKNTLKLIDRAMRKEDNSPQVNIQSSYWPILLILSSHWSGQDCHRVTAASARL